VGSKNFAESRLLGELFAQLIEERTELRVERRLGLAGTQVCFEALRSGAIDLYPEYTGTGLVSILGEEATGTATETLNRVRRSFLDRWDLWWLPPLGFENAYEIAVPKTLAEAKGLRTLTDLVPLAPQLRGGFGYEFANRPDGLPGLERTYGLRFRSVQNLQQALKYQAAGNGNLDVLDVYTTDGRLLVHDLVVLEDDRGFFPPYQAAPLMRGETVRSYPEAVAALALLADALDEDTMRALNLRLQEEGASEARVARDALATLGLIAGDSAEEIRESRRAGSFWDYLWKQRAPLLRRTVEHLGLAAAGVVLGVLVAVPLGLWLERRRRIAEPTIRAIGITQTVPSIALLAFMIPLFGVGALPAVVALWIYSLFPILRNTYTGVRDADPQVVESATALGMTDGQVLRHIRLPLAAPVILAGVRTAAVITVGTATLAAFIGAGGLGEPIVSGLQLVDTWQILSGALPAALLALLVDTLLAGVERWLRPGG
jgi:osmoprotectant transport system permease protein